MHYRNPPDTAPMLTYCLKAGTWFGFAQVDIEIPKLLWGKFEEIPPFIFTKQIRGEAMSQNMKDNLQRTDRTRGNGEKAERSITSAKAVGVCFIVAQVCSTRCSHQSCSSHDRLSGEEYLHLVRGASDSGLAHQICRQEQSFACWGVQTAGKKGLQKQRNAWKRWSAGVVDKTLRSAYFSYLEQLG